ncbi:MAG: META domain-containing protein [Flavobacteriales bacterium]|nr:META domain-containing protein [Flavobacteriales bacterium]
MRLKLPFLALALGLVLSANKCADKGMPANIFDTKWMLQSLAGQAIQMPAGAEMPWLKLAADKSLSGFGGCNNLMGQFSLDGSSIGFPGVGSTKKFCEGTQKVEDSFLGALREAKSFKVEDGLMKLMNGDKELAAFSKGN